MVDRTMLLQRLVLVEACRKRPIFAADSLHEKADDVNAAAKHHGQTHRACEFVRNYLSASVAKHSAIVQSYGYVRM